MGSGGFFWLADIFLVGHRPVGLLLILQQNKKENTAYC